MKRAASVVENARARSLLKRPASSAAGRGLRIVQYRKNGLRTGPRHGSDLVRCYPARGVPERGMSLGIVAELAIPMFRNFKAQRKGPQMGNFTQEFDGRFRIAVLQFPVCRTHAAH